MSRFIDRSLRGRKELNGGERNGHHRADMHRRSPRHAKEEIDTETQHAPGSGIRRTQPPQLRFFPRRFPMPKMLLGTLTISAGVLVIAALFFQVSEILTPIMLALLAVVLLYPFRDEPKLRPVMVAGAIVFIAWFLAQSIMILLPFMMAFLLAYIVEPVVTKLQRKFYIKRWISSLVVTLVLVGLLVVMAVYITPILTAQVGNAISSVDELIERGIDWARDGGLAGLTGLSQEKIDEMINRYIVPKANGIDEVVIDQAEKTAVALPGIISSTFHFLTIPLIMFYFIKDYWRIRASLYSFIPKEYQVRSQRLLRDLDEIVGGFLRGEVIVGILQGVMIGVGLHFIGVPGALLLGVLTGFLCLIPFVGVFIAYSICVFATLYTGEPLTSLLYVTLLFAAQAIVESTLIAPQIMSRHTDLHPLLVIFAILIFGFFWGVTGMLVAIPVTSLLLRFAIRWRTRRHHELEREKVMADIERNPHHARGGEGAKRRGDETATW